MAQWGQIGFGNPIIVSATVLGDIISLNWDGGPVGPSLGFPNPAATQGYYQDAGDGIAQFQSALMTPQFVVIDKDNNNDVIGNFVGDSNGVGLGSVAGIPFSIASGASMIIDVAGGSLSVFRAEMTAVKYPRTTAQALPNATLTTVDWHAPSWEYGHNSFSESSGVITVPEAGLVDIFVYIEWSPSSGTGERLVNLRHNGSLEMGDRRAGIGNTQRTSLSTTVDVGINDTIDVQCHQNSGAPMTITDASIKLAYRETATIHI